MFQKIWERHEVVPETPETPAVLYIDLHLLHEVTTPQAFTMLPGLGPAARRPSSRSPRWTTGDADTREAGLSAARRSP
jgi:homoaconitase/3-isopropylmalate dehydratase large subunit